MTTQTLPIWLSRAIRKRALGQAVDNARLDLELLAAGMTNDAFDRLVAEDRRDLHSQRRQVADEANVARQELDGVRGNREQSQSKLEHAKRESEVNGVEQDSEMIASLQAEFDKYSAQEQQLRSDLEACERELMRLRG